MAKMRRREFLKTAAAGLAAAPAGGAAETDRPNVLLIMTDQHRRDAIGAYGNAAIRTPHLDSLAREGVRFNNCWAQHPVCMPSRASIFTGRYPLAHGVRCNGVPLPRHEVTLAQVFARHGYRTGGAGKFHFTNHYQTALPTMEDHPDPFYGFQEFHIGEDQRLGEQALWIQRQHPEFAGKPDSQIPLELHNSYWTASHTIDFIRRCRNRQEPFFAFCSFVDPHHAYNPPPPYGTMYSERDMPAPTRQEGELDDKPPFFKQRAQSYEKLSKNVAALRAQYYGEVSLIDDSIGRILAALEEWKLRENTLIIMTADHGDLLGDHWLFYKGPFHYAACANTPLIISWRKGLKTGKIVEGIVQEIDIFPTVTELVGLKNPPGVQGRSQAAVLTGEGSDTGYESAFIEVATSGAILPGVGLPERDNPDVYTLRTPQWRLGYYPGQPYGELYHLEEDANEFVNRWNDPGLDRVRRRLTEELLERIVRARDPLPLREQRY